MEGGESAGSHASLTTYLGPILSDLRSTILIDNNSARILANNPEHHRKAKHIDI